MLFRDFDSLFRLFCLERKVVIARLGSLLNKGHRGRQHRCKFRSNLFLQLSLWLFTSSPRIFYPFPKARAEGRDCAPRFGGGRKQHGRVLVRAALLHARMGACQDAGGEQPEAGGGQAESRRELPRDFNFARLLYGEYHVCLPRVFCCLRGRARASSRSKTSDPDAHVLSLLMALAGTC
jgi:hypothetical protein